ncbi:MAG TPA: formate dehydrogenase-N subunit alpha [Methylomirabilota bacterium]|nr:formate dehydrogenase-N subunit alpha [Methylomirabilota bacterium]
MSLSRRDFLKYGAGVAGTTLATQEIDLRPVEAAASSLRIKEAKVYPGVCPYCAVGCAQLIYVKDNKIIDIEGDPDAPHTEGALCPKGSSTFQVSVNSSRLTKCLYRAPGSDRWEEKPLDWMMDQIAQRIKKTRDETFVQRARVGGRNLTVNRCEGIAWMGSSVLDNEENYLIAKLARGLGIVNLENSARICHSATVPALGATFGRGAMTTNLIDVKNADVIMPTSNWAECHPVSYKWVMEAKARGAKVIHVDPRFTRTSATADIWVPIRSGTNIVFFGGLIRYAIETKKYFHDYVVAYTNASLLLDPSFKTPADLEGLFSGLEKTGKSGTDPHSSYRYDRSTWRFQLDADGYPKKDPTLRDPNCVFQHLRKHYDRYTPEMVERVCGISKDLFLQVADTFCSASGPDKTGTISYALQLNQSTNGVQQIRSLCMLQMVLGNIGRPGGGVVALRGHSNVQGATDMATLYHILPGYLAPPLQAIHPTLTDYLERETPKGGYWVNKPKFFISLLKAWWGDAATKDNDFAYEYLPKREKADAYSHQHFLVGMLNKQVKGFIVMGQNPGVDSPNAKMARTALRNLEWMAVVDLFETETATVWKEPGLDPKTVQTEVFFIPGAPAAEKDGSLTNTMRLLQWHLRAVEPPGEARSDAAFIVELGDRVKALYKGSTAAKDRPVLDLVWDYEVQGAKKEPNMEHVLKEVNGYATADITEADGKPLYKKGQPVKTFAHLRDDGSTACGNWICTGVYPEEGKNLALRREKPKEGDYLAHEWGFVWPANRRILYNRASADPRGRPWSEKKKLIWWDAKQKKWVGLDVPDFSPVMAPNAPRAKEGPLKGISGTDAFIMTGHGLGQFFAALNDGPFPEHYEPFESPTKNLLSKVQNNPVAKYWDIGDLNKLGTPDKYPYILTTYRLTEHHAAGMSRHVPWLSELFFGHFAEVNPEMAKELGIQNGDMITVESPRATIHTRALVTERIKPFVIDGKKVYQVGIPWHWGYQGVMKSARGDITNDLVASLGDPTTYIQESKALLCNVRKGVA